MQQNQLPSWKPRSFQLAGVKLGIAQACAGLLFPPGGGKTSTMYMIFRILKDKGYVKRMLVICPIRPMYRVWPNQKNDFAEFAHLEVAVLHGKDREAALNSDADIYVVNPEGLEWLFDAKSGKPSAARAKWIKERFDVLCVDESTKFKNSGSKRFKLLKQFVKFFKRRYILTGTIAPNGLLDLFGQIYILDEGASLGRYITHYRNEYFMPSGFGGYDYQLLPGSEERIAEAIDPLVMRIDLSDIGSDLPAEVYDDILVDLPPTARKLYEDMEDEMMLALESGDLVAANAAVASSKCRQICNGGIIDTENGTWLDVHDAKMEALADLIEQLQGERLLVTFEFKFDRQKMEQRFKIPCISTGNAAHDSKFIDLFSRGLVPVVMGNPQSIALGIDGLQKSCHHIAMIGCTWNLQDYQQVILRVRRQGNKSPHVFIHRILARGTIDQRVVNVLGGKDVSQESFMQLLRRQKA